MTTDQAVRAGRRGLGLCTVCGKALDDRAYVRCAACREKSFEKNKQRYSKKDAGEEMAFYNELEARKAEIARAIECEKVFKTMGKCLNCVWSQKHTTHLFCPFPAGACMRL